MDNMPEIAIQSECETYWPAEWERQSATWIAWPHNRDTWPGRFEPIPSQFRRFIATLSEVQLVHVLSGPTTARPSASELLSGLKNVHIHSITTNDSWIRDFGPTFVRNRQDDSLVGIDWRYNAWGGKYPPYDADAAAAEKICQVLGCLYRKSNLYCEGGALETDGEGTLLTTGSCLLSSSRNPHWTRVQVELELQQQLGVRQIIWVDGGGLDGDDTDGHIDQLARFVRPGVVVAASSNAEDEPNHAGLEKNLQILARACDASGRAFEVHRLPIPPARFIDGVRVPESYCNFLLANGILVVPTFRHPANDAAALELLGALFPDRTLIPQDASDLAWGLGAFHCLSQQQPA